MTQGSPATYIFPLMPGSDFTNSNLFQFQKLMFKPLYWFGQDGHITLNQTQSLADAPTWSKDGKTLTIKLKSYKWSNGESLTARDVEFWQNLVKANKANWGDYVPGNYPDNVVSTKIVNPTTIQFTLNKAYNHTWFLYNELSQVTPLPLAWDKTSASGKTGTADQTPAGAAAVYKFLTKQAQDLGSYGTNPLWKVVDGPWVLQQYQTSGQATFVPNTKYSGPDKPHLSKFIELPFTSNAAEFSAVKSGQTIDVGYLPPEDAPQAGLMKSQGYNVAPWTDWNMNFMGVNFNSPAGPMFKQLYIRQALQYVEDQPALVSSAFHGYAWPVYGPVPPQPSNPYISTTAKTNPYPFSIAKAKALITSHGWTTSGGTTTCAHPGTGANQCGAGIAAGTKLQFNLLYATGLPALQQSMQVYKSNAGQAGITINLSEAPINTVFGDMSPCQPGPKCSWELGNYGVGWTYAPDYYPTGAELFSTGAGTNFGSYSDPTNDANIKASEMAPPSQTQQALTTYQDYLVKNLPVIWQPNPDFQISLIKSNLAGVTPQDPGLMINPQNWYFTK